MQNPVWDREAATCISDGVCFQDDLLGPWDNLQANLFNNVAEIGTTRKRFNE